MGSFSLRLCRSAVLTSSIVFGPCAVVIKDLESRRAEHRIGLRYVFGPALENFVLTL